MQGVILKCIGMNALHVPVCMEGGREGEREGVREEGREVGGGEREGK